MKYQILRLKDIGHQLLDEYVVLNPSNNSSGKERRYAYMRLAHKLHIKNAHFSMMNTEEEVENAIVKLKIMIKHRKKKIERLGISQKKFAANLAELQKSIKFEKIT